MDPDAVSESMQVASEMTWLIPRFGAAGLAVGPALQGTPSNLLPL